MIISKITTNAQTTIPQTVCDILGVGPGDQLAYRIEGSRVILEHIVPNDSELTAWTSLLSEWSAPKNDVYDQLWNRDYTKITASPYWAMV
jgi:antitoxin PrlF